MIRPSKRWIIGAAVLAAVAVGAGLVMVGIPLVSIGAAYKAKTVCSEVFVAGRRADSVIAGLAIDDLRLLRVIRTEVDDRDGTATARFFPIAERRARFQGEHGCTLEARGTPAAPTRPAARHTDAAVTPDSIATLTPEGRRAVEAAVDDAFAEPDSSHSRRTRAVVVMQHGAVVAERYAGGVARDTPMPGWSMTKSVLNALVGIAVQEGKLAVDSPVKLAAWNVPSDPRCRITVGDLLRMSSGLRFDEAQASVKSDILRMLFDERDMAAFAASKPLDVEPGQRWRYSTGTSVILSRVLREALGDDVYRRWPRQALFEPLGMTRAVLEVIRAAPSSRRRTCTPRRASGRGSDNSISRTACGWAHASFR